MYLGKGVKAGSKVSENAPGQIWEGRETTKTNGKNTVTKKMTTAAPSQEGQPRGHSQKLRKVAHDAKYLYGEGQGK